VPVEIAHIKPCRRDGSMDTFENLIALCPTCHARYDAHDIDRMAMRQYRGDLGTLASRYCDYERRILETLGNQITNDPANDPRRTAGTSTVYQEQSDKQ
jgi:hypothetical protein